jgi:hypothetical protein
MKRSGVGVGLFLVLVAIGATTAAIAESAGPTATASSPTRASSCGNLRYKPSEIVIACGDAGLRATDLVWSRWTKKVADATGTGVAKTCVPDCASGGFQSAPIAVHLHKTRKCSRGGRIFSKGSWAWIGTPPPNESAGGAVVGFCPVAGKGYWTNCGVFELQGDVLVHRVACSKGRSLVKTVFIRSQSQGPNVEVSGFSCTGKTGSGGLIVNCSKGGKRVHWKGAIS